MSPLLIGKLLHTGWPRGYRLERYSFIRSFCTERVLQVGGAIGWTMCWQICTQLCEPMNPAMLGTWGFVVIGKCKKGTMVQQCMRPTFAVFYVLRPLHVAQVVLCTLHCAVSPLLCVLCTLHSVHTACSICVRPAQPQLKGVCAPVMEHQSQ